MLVTHTRIIALIKTIVVCFEKKFRTVTLRKSTPSVLDHRQL